MPFSPSLLSRFQKADVKLFWAATGKQTVLEVCLATRVSTTKRAYDDVAGVCDNAGSVVLNCASDTEKQQQIWNKIAGDLHRYTGYKETVDVAPSHSLPLLLWLKLTACTTSCRPRHHSLNPCMRG